MYLSEQTPHFHFKPLRECHAGVHTKISTDADADVKSADFKINIIHKVLHILTWNFEYIFIMIYFILWTQKSVHCTLKSYFERLALFWYRYSTITLLC